MAAETKRLVRWLVLLGLAGALLLWLLARLGLPFVPIIATTQSRAIA